MAVRSEPITGDALAELYLGITRRFYGHADRIVVVDDYVANEWSYIPHFYSEFYVFQYATSFTAAETLAARVIGGDAAATQRFLTFLSAGSSKYPIELLQDAGVDMTTDEPLDQTMRTMNRIMDEIEAVLGG
jgi:oligoendopeptidase F